MAILRAEAIVLKTFDFRETSIIAGFFTKEYGKLKGILKGVRSDPKKFGSTLEPFSVNEIIFYQKRNSELHLISQCDIKDNFNNIRAGLKSVAFASYLVDLVEHLTPLEETNREVYGLVFYALKQIDCGLDPEKILRIFLVKFLKLIGFKPRLDGCIMCDGNINSQAYFSVRHGGLLCQECAAGKSDYTSVFKGTIASILHMEKNDWQEALRLELNGKVKEELNRIIQSFMEYHLQVRPKSAQVLEAIG